jgi:hypothetical protein
MAFEQAYIPQVRMDGAISPLPHTPSQRGAVKYRIGLHGVVLI